MRFHESLFALAGFVLNIDAATIFEPSDRRLQDEPCTLLVRATEHEGQDRTMQVYCLVPSTDRIVTITGTPNIQAELLAEFESGALISNESTLRSSSAYHTDNGDLQLPNGLNDVEFSVDKTSRQGASDSKKTGRNTMLAVKIHRERIQVPQPSGAPVPQPSGSPIPTTNSPVPQPSGSPIPTTNSPVPHPTPVPQPSGSPIPTTNSPVPQPSGAPVPTGGPGCVDNDNAHFLWKDKNGSCSWLAQQKRKKIKKVCKQNDCTLERLVPRRVCPKLCKFCKACKEKKRSKFFAGEEYGTKKCKWLKKADDGVKVALCSIEESPICYGTARDICPKACKHVTGCVGK